MSNDFASTTPGCGGPTFVKKLSTEGNISKTHPPWRILVDSRARVYSGGIVNRLADHSFPGSRSTVSSWKPLSAFSSAVCDARRGMSTIVLKPSTLPPARSARPLTLAIRAAATALEMTKMFLRRRFVRDVKVRATKFRESLIRLGPFYVKLGQALSTRPDILPPEYCAELTKLQDRMPPFPSSAAHSLIRSELGFHPNKIFSEFSELPVAAASLGQVYKARLRSGQLVAVKVQRPNVSRDLHMDAIILRQVAALFQRLLAGPSDLVAIADQLVARMFEEVDYEQEGRHAEHFAELYGDRSPTAKSGKGGATVKVPRIFWTYSTKKVLTMEWIDGIKLTDAAGLRTANLDIQYIVDLGVVCSLRQLLQEGFFHADPHPGNLVVTSDGQLAYFDFGMMSQLSAQQSYGLIRAVVHYVNKDGRGLAEDFRDLGFIPASADVSAVARALNRSLKTRGARPAGSSALNFQGVFADLSTVMQQFRMRLPPEFSLVVRALGSLEGTASALDPTFQVLASAYPFIIARLLNDPSPDTRQLLLRLLLRPNGAVRWQRIRRLMAALQPQRQPQPQPQAQQQQQKEEAAPGDTAEGRNSAAHDGGCQGDGTVPKRSTLEARSHPGNSSEYKALAIEVHVASSGRDDGLGKSSLAAEDGPPTTIQARGSNGGSNAGWDSTSGGSSSTSGVRSSTSGGSSSSSGDSGSSGGMGTSMGSRRHRDELREDLDEATVAAAVSHIVSYVLSPQGAATRRWLVSDAIAAAEASSQKQLERVKKEASRGDEGEEAVETQAEDVALSLTATAEALSRRLQRSPAIWLPVVTKVVFDPEARQMAAAISRGVSGITVSSAIQLALLRLSLYFGYHET